MSSDNRLVIEFDEHDLKQLQDIFHAARSELGEEIQEGQIIEACRELLGKAQQAGAPGFVMTRLERLQDLVAMIEDHDWQLPQEDASRVINALAYFANAQDLIPDDVPGLGYLDDAVMVDLVTRELADEIKSYEDFRAFRSSEVQKRTAAGDERPVTRSDWLASQREKVQAERKSKSWLPWRRKSDSFLD